MKGKFCRLRYTKFQFTFLKNTIKLCYIKIQFSSVFAGRQNNDSAHALAAVARNCSDETI